MKTEFDLQAIEQSGRAKGERDLEKCENSDVALNLAIAKQILEIYEQISSFWGHRLAHIPNIFEAKEDDQALFRQTLSLNFAAQYLCLYAALNGMKLDKDIMDLSFYAKQHVLIDMRSPKEIVSVIKSDFLAPRYFADQFNNCVTDRIDFHTRSIYGVPSESIYWMFEKSLRQDEDHATLLAAIEQRMQASALENLKSLKPSKP